MGILISVYGLREVNAHVYHLVIMIILITKQTL